MSALFSDPAQWLPVVFAGLMGMSILVYVVLDGFDLGVGLLSPFASPEERDRMIASIGPFWDANETWLVLAIGLLLVAFPAAHGEILSNLYLPVAVMLIGLILRGVAFEFRMKAPGDQKRSWDAAFFWGSLMASLAQGFMLGIYLLGLDWSLWAMAFAGLTALCLTAAYAFIGATWLIYKTEDRLQRRSVLWARRTVWGVLIGLLAVSVASPLVSQRIFEKWFSFPEIVLLAPLPIISALVGFVLIIALRALPARGDAWSWTPFAATLVLFCLAFCGLAYSFYPYVVPGTMTIYEAAAAPESLMIILIGTLAVLPVIIGYTCVAYFIFRGKASPLDYG